MSAQIRRKGKLIEQEYGRRLYASDEDFPGSMKETPEKYVADRLTIIKQSEFKKPYLEDDYSGMEYKFNPPGTPTFAPQNPDQGFDPRGLPDTCKPVILSVDGKYFDCDCENDCYVEMKISCSPNVLNVVIAGQLFKKSELRFLVSGAIEAGYPRSDTVNYFAQTTVKIEPGEKVPFKIETKTGAPSKKTQPIYNSKTGEKIGEARYSAGLIEGQMEFGCCEEEGASIGYTSQQMSVNDTQELTAQPGALPETCYLWAIVSGGGSLSSNMGKTVTYTAPATNPNCANNATISLTIGKMNPITLQIAINGWSPGTALAVTYESADNPHCTSCFSYRNGYGYSCNGQLLGTNENFSTSRCNVFALCVEPACVVPQTPVAGGCFNSRTQAMKDGGCCPQQLFLCEQWCN